ncbi:MAG: hypothetical protein MRQ08_04395, partial [Candidatus Midichloria mitochondrii]|nr:hypothetical protein [Candidatus Midichloria mitochondrii]
GLTKTPSQGSLCLQTRYISWKKQARGGAYSLSRTEANLTRVPLRISQFFIYKAVDMDNI